MIRQVDTNLYRGPRLQESEYQELVKDNIKYVINLEDDSKAIRLDQGYCVKLGISFSSEPMNELFCTPLDRLLSIVDYVWQLIQYGPVYVHCRRGIDRTGQVIAALKIRYMGVSFDSAYNEMVDLGHPQLYDLLGWKYVLSKVRPL